MSSPVAETGYVTAFFSSMIVLRLIGNHPNVKSVHEYYNKTVRLTYLTLKGKYTWQLQKSEKQQQLKKERQPPKEKPQLRKSAKFTCCK